MRCIVIIQVLILTVVSAGAGVIHAYVSPLRVKIEDMVPTWHEQAAIAARKKIDQRENNADETAKPVIKNNGNGATVDPIDPETGSVSDSSDPTAGINLDTLRENISLREAKALFDSDLVTFVDARSYDVYKNGHIENAISIPYDVIREIDGVPPHMANGVIDPSESVIVVYCKGGDCDESLLVAQELKGLGFTCHIFLDGFPAWKKEGYPIVEGPDEWLVGFGAEPDTADGG